jgi:hypothetical protein
LAANAVRSSGVMAAIWASSTSCFKAAAKSAESFLTSPAAF